MPTDKEEHEVITTKLDEILKILNGNGKIGICAKVSVMWSCGLFLVCAVVTLFIKTFLL